MTWWWLSFADHARPHGQQFLGAAVVGPALSGVHALMLSHALGCNPGGEVALLEIPSEVALRIPPAYKRRLLTRVECTTLDDLLGPP